MPQQKTDTWAPNRCKHHCSWCLAGLLFCGLDEETERTLQIAKTAKPPLRPVSASHEKSSANSLGSKARLQPRWPLRALQTVGRWPPETDLLSIVRPSEPWEGSHGHGPRCSPTFFSLGPYRLWLKWMPWSEKVAYIMVHSMNFRSSQQTVSKGIQVWAAPHHK